MCVCVCVCVCVSVCVYVNKEEDTRKQCHRMWNSLNSIRTSHALCRTLFPRTPATTTSVTPSFFRLPAYRFRAYVRDNAVDTRFDYRLYWRRRRSRFRDWRNYLMTSEDWRSYLTPEEANIYQKSLSLLSKSKTDRSVKNAENASRLRDRNCIVINESSGLQEEISKNKIDCRQNLDY